MKKEQNLYDDEPEVDNPAEGDDGNEINPPKEKEKTQKPS